MNNNRNSNFFNDVFRFDNSGPAGNSSSSAGNGNRSPSAENGNRSPSAGNGNSAPYAEHRASKTLGRNASTRNLTSPGMLRLLKQYTLTEQQGLLELSGGRIRLVPHVHIAGRSATIDFKIGIDRLYVVKNVQDFTDHCDNCDLAGYGKGLSFYHHPDAFDESSRSLVRFLLDSVHAYENKKRDWKTFRGPYYTANDFRYWPLSNEELGKLFQLYRGSSLAMDINGLAPQSYVFRPGTVKPSLKLSGRPGQGLVLQLEDRPVISDGEFLYYLPESVDQGSGSKGSGSKGSGSKDSGSKGSGSKGSGSKDSTEKEPGGPAYDSMTSADKVHGIQPLAASDSTGLILYSPANALSKVTPFINYMQTMPKGICMIGERELPVFCRNMLPVLADHMDLSIENFNPDQYLPKEVTFRIYLDLPQDDMVICYLEALYFDQIFYPFKDYAARNNDFGQSDELRQIMTNGLKDSYRNFALENHICNTLMPMFTSFDPGSGLMCLQGDSDVICEFLSEKLPIIEGLGELYISDYLKNMLKPRKVRVNVGVSLTSNLLNLSADTSGLSLEEMTEIFSSYDKKKKYHRFRDGSFLNLEKESALRNLYEAADALDLPAEKLAGDGVTLPAYRAMYLDQTLLADENIKVEKDKSYRSLLRSMKTIEDSDYDVPKELDGVLREYQKTGYRFLKTLYHNGFGGILADDMGLGKTLQVITFLLSEQAPDGGANRRTLIVCPSSLIYNWSQEIEKFAPSLHHSMLTGNAKARQAQIRESAEDEILITSYDQLKRDLDAYEGIPFFCQILDEAQYIKNQNTQAAKAVKSIASGFRLALTGTPIENRLSELWSIFDYLMPDFLYKYPRFRKEIEIPVIEEAEKQRACAKENPTEKMKGFASAETKGFSSAETKGFTSEKTSGNPSGSMKAIPGENPEASMSASLKLKKLIRPFVLRRLKTDVLTELPEKLEEAVYASMSSEQKTLYEAHASRLKMILASKTKEELKSSRIQILAELTRLRQLCCEPSLVYENYTSGSGKVDTCIELVRQAVEGGHRMLIFSQFTSVFPILEKRLQKEGIDYLELTGSNSKQERNDMVQDFQSGNIPVFLISLKAGGTGLNLTAADVVIHFDPWWNIAAQNQATDRVHRIGQENPVSVFKLITKNTIEERIMHLQEAKGQLAESVLSGEGLDSGNFSADELIELLGAE